MAEVYSVGAVTQKVLRKCPLCGDESPKDLVGGDDERKTNWLMFVVLLVVFFPLLVFTSLWRKKIRVVKAYCRACKGAFDPGPIGKA